MKVRVGSEYVKNIARTYKRTLVDAHFVLPLGAKVNNNKRRVSVVYTNWGIVRIFDIKDCQLLL